MLIHRHAEKALVALGQKMPVPASAMIQRLKEAPAPEEDTAIELCRLQYAHGPIHQPTGTNGDQVVAVVRGGAVVTIMLRRSWSQPFTPDALRVQEVRTWHAT